MMGWDTHPRGTCWVPRCHGCARIWGTQGMSWAVSFQQPPSVAHGQPAARLNAARPVCGEACPVQLDFWRGWSQPRHQPLPARCCRLRQSRARRQVVAPSPRGRHSPRMGHAGPAPCSVPTLWPFLGERCPMEAGKEQPLPSWRDPPVCGVCALRKWRRSGTMRTTHRGVHATAEGLFDGKNAGHLQELWDAGRTRSSASSVGGSNPTLGMEAGRKERESGKDKSWLRKSSTLLQGAGFLQSCAR